MKQRNPDLRTVLDLYSRVPSLRSSEGWHECFYCGDPADAHDHCPPISRVDDYRALGLRNERFFLVVACKECNDMLGSTLQASLAARHDVLKHLLFARYAKRLKTPYWSAEELSELGPRMRREVKAAMRVAERIEQRLAYDRSYAEWLRSLDL